MKIIIIIVIYISFCFSIKAQTKTEQQPIYKIFLVNRDSVNKFEYNKDNNEILRIGKLFNTNDFHAFLLFKIRPNIYKLELFYRENKKWKSIYMDTINFVFILNINFIDYNNDNSNDLIISTASSIPLDFLYLYEPKSKSLIKIKEILKYPETKIVKSNPNYFYSYKAIGCADNNWESKLLYFEGSHLLLYAEISANGCNQNKITIRFRKSNQIKELELSNTLKSYGNDKFVFIEKYWDELCKSLK